MKEIIKWNSFLEFRDFKFFTTQRQVICVVFLFVLICAVTYWMTIQGVDYYGVPLENTGVLAPIYEEVVFRGIILAVLFSRFSAKKAIFVSALLFGILHLRNVVYYGLSFDMLAQVFWAFTLGVLFAWVTIKTGTVWFAVILHFLNNILASAWILWGAFILI